MSTLISTTAPNAKQIPALGVSLCEDNVQLDRELVAHGISNVAAGLVGTASLSFEFVIVLIISRFQITLLT